MKVVIVILQVLRDSNHQNSVPTKVACDEMNINATWRLICIQMIGFMQ